MYTLLPDDVNKPILCYYVNTTNKIQIARITNIPNWHFERVVFPQERLLFKAFPEAFLEIYTGAPDTTILSEGFWCYLLYVQEELIGFPKPIMAKC